MSRQRQQPTAAHPSITRVRAALTDQSAAQTARGLVRYIRAHPGCLDTQPDPYARYRWTPRAGRWPVDERERRRLTHDPTYRRARVAELRRAATVTPTTYTPERYDKSLAAVLRARTLALPAVSIRARGIATVGGVEDLLPYKPIGINGTAGPTLGTAQRDRRDGETEWDMGKPISYTRCVDSSSVLSAAVLRRAGRIVDYWFQVPGGERERYTLAAPATMRWDVDTDGLRLVCGPDDYHPMAGEMRSGVARLAEILRGNAETRRRLAAERAVERAEAEGVWVCLADSLRAGNCRAGSTAWAERHGLDVLRHVPAGRLFEEANGDWPRVRLAIRAAMTRHAAEMVRGYADLSEHTV